MKYNVSNPKLWIGGAVLGLLAFTGWIVGLEPGNPPDFALFLGRFHPLVVHLPIALLLLAVVLEGLARRPRFQDLSRAITFVLGLGAVSAVAAAGAGYLLSLGGGYDAATLGWHKYLGLALAATALAAWGLRVWTRRPGGAALRNAYPVALGGVAVLLIAAGHLGGSLTHGAGYLTRYLPAPLRTLAGFPGAAAANPFAAANLPEAVVYADLVHPILEHRCVSCHGGEKARGGLRLDTPEGIQAGGDDGPVVAAGSAAESELIRRLLLPPWHDKHMPPDGRQPLAAAEVELLRWWIDQGASFELTVAQAEQTPFVQAILFPEGTPGERPPSGVFALDIPPADTQHVARLRRAGATVAPLAQTSPLLQVAFPPAPTPFGDVQLEALRPLARQITWLDLGGTAVSDSSLAVLPSFPHLTRLHLERTRVTDAGLQHLSGLDYLEYLNLYGTTISDDGLEQLAGLKNLRSLYLWQTRATEAGIARLKQQLPALEIDTGVEPPALPGPDAAGARAASAG